VSWEVYLYASVTDLYKNVKTGCALPNKKEQTLLFSARLALSLQTKKY